MILSHLSLPTLISDLLLRRSLMLALMKNLGSALSKNMLFLPKRTISQQDQLDGLITVSLEDKVRFTALSEQTLPLEELFLMLTIRLACMLESK